MTKTHRIEAIARSAVRSAQATGRPTFLVVGDEAYTRRAMLRLPVSVSARTCRIFNVADQIMNHPHPDIVLSFAITPMFDCLDLAQLLWLYGFRNRQRIVDQNLPNPEIICREVASVCPGLDFGVFDPTELGLF